MPLTPVKTSGDLQERVDNSWGTYDQIGFSLKCKEKTLFLARSIIVVPSTSTYVPQGDSLIPYSTEYLIGSNTEYTQ